MAGAGLRFWPASSLRLVLYLSRRARERARSLPRNPRGPVRARADGAPGVRQGRRPGPRSGEACASGPFIRLDPKLHPKARSQVAPPRLVPKLHLGTRFSPEAPLRHPSPLLDPVHLKNRVILQNVVACRRISPMLRRIHIPPPDRILMNVRDLLRQHLVALDKRRMRPFLPDLVSGAQGGGQDNTKQSFSEKCVPKCNFGTS